MHKADENVAIADGGLLGELYADFLRAAFGGTAG
jgi:hypothetical protein